MNNVKYYAVSFGVLMALTGSVIVLADEVEEQPLVLEETEEVSYVFEDEMIVDSAEPEIIQETNIVETVEEPITETEEAILVEENVKQESSEGISLRSPGDGWGEDTGGIYYVVDGNRLQQTVQEIDGFLYGFNNSGYLYMNQRFQLTPYWYQATEDGKLCVNQWYEQYGARYYYGYMGRGVNEMQNIDGQDYYFNDGLLVVNSAFEYDTQPYYADENGNVHFMDYDGWYYVPQGNTNMNTYLVDNGTLINYGIHYYNNAYYYFYQNGQLARNVTNTVSDITPYSVRSKDSGELYENEWYYEQDYGYKYYYGFGARSAYGFYYVDNKQYYFDSSGKLYFDTAATIGTKVYIFQEDGSYSTADTDGWYNSGTHSYYVQNGNLIRGHIVNKDGFDYYLTQDGSMLVNDIAHNGNYTDANYTPCYYGANWEGKIIKNDFFLGYYFGSDGKSLPNGLHTIDGFNYYTESGRYLTNTIRNIDGINYIFDLAGTASIAKEGITENINTYYVIDGELATGFYNIDGKDAYFEAGIMLKNGVIQVADDAYMVADREGNLLKNSFYTFDYVKDPIYKYAYPSYPLYFYGTVYLDENGRVVEGMRVIDGRNYFFSTDQGSRFTLIQNDVFKYNGNWYAADSAGVCRISYVWDGFVVAGNSRFFMHDYELVKNQLYEIAGSLYAFDINGKLIQNGFWTAHNPRYNVYRTDSEGKIIKSQWVTVENEGKQDGEYYFYSDGTGANDFCTINGTTYYFVNGRKLANEIRQMENGALFRFREDGTFTTSVPDGVYEGRSLQVVRNGVLVTNELYPYMGWYYLIDGTGSSKWGEGVQIINYVYERNEPIYVFMSPDGPTYRYPQIQYAGNYAYFPTDAANLVYGYLQNYFGNDYAVVRESDGHGGFFPYLVKNAPVTIKGVNYYADEIGVLHKAVLDVEHNLSLDGNIGVNFYIAFTDEVTSDSGARVDFTVDGITISKSVADAQISTIYGRNFHRFSVDVTASQMTSKIKADVVLSSEKTVYSELYCVKDYCDKKLSDSSTTEKLRTLLESLLNYGGYSQVFFNKNLDNLANKDLENTDVSYITAETLKPYEIVKTGSQTGLNYQGSTLTLDSLTSIKHYFTVDSGHSINEYTFTLNGQTLTPVASGNMYYVEIPNIKSYDLDTTYTVNAGGIVIKYSGLSYAYTQLNKANASNNLKNVCRALYKYNQAANSYFGM